MTNPSKNSVMVILSLMSLFYFKILKYLTPFADTVLEFSLLFNPACLTPYFVIFILYLHFFKINLRPFLANSQHLQM